MTYAYADSTVVLGPLAPSGEPAAYDLCAHHAAGLSAPKGWEMVRLPGEFRELPASDDALDALADAIRRAGLEPGELDPFDLPSPPIARRKGHLAVLADPV